MQLQHILLTDSDLAARRARLRQRRERLGRDVQPGSQIAQDPDRTRLGKTDDSWIARQFAHIRKPERIAAIEESMKTRALPVEAGMPPERDRLSGSLTRTLPSGDWLLSAAEVLH